MGKIKCPECLGCMDYVWVDNSRYLYCFLCNLWYNGLSNELHVVENPYLIEHSECEGKGCVVCVFTGKIDRRRV